MDKHNKPGSSGRREFLKKINLLGALSVSGSLLDPAIAESAGNDALPVNFTDFVANANSWPKISYTKNSPLSRVNGPNLANLFCRLDVPISGNLKHFQVIGNGTEIQFIRALHVSESYVFYKNKFYPLAASDEISYEYALTYIDVIYKNKVLPFEVLKKIYLHPRYATCIQHVHVKNTSQQPIEIFFVEKARFTLADPYYTNYIPLAKDNYNGFRVGNEVYRGYSARFLMYGKDITRVCSRDDQIQFQMQTLKSPWKADQHSGKTCDDQSVLLQIKLQLLPGKENNDFVVHYSAGVTSNEQIHGIPELSSMFEKDHFRQFEKDLAQQATALAMIHTPDQLLNQGFAISNKVSSQVFRSVDGLVVLPGHMYPSFYSRDSHWQIRGLLAGGKFEEVKGLLTHFTRFQNEEGSFPTRIDLMGKPLYHTGAPDLDSAALISLSIIEYVRYSKDLAFGAQYWKSIANSIEFLRNKDKDNDGWIEQDYNQDWADRTRRHGKVNYTQCIYFQLVKEAAELGEILNKSEVVGYKKIIQKLKRNYDALFWDEEEGFYIDYISPDGVRMKKMSQDTCLAFIFGLADDRKKIKRHLSKMKERCWTKWGPKHHEGYKDGDVYDPLGFYCNGGVWMWLTAFEAYAHFKFGNPEDGVIALNAIKEYEFGKNPYAEVYFDTTEWHDSINGLNCEYDWKQCRNFTTGSGAHVWAIIEGLFGLQLSINGEISWSPNFPARWNAKSLSLNGIRHGDDRMNKEFIFDGSWK